MKQRLDIALVVPGLPFNGETFPKQSLGGSESAGYYMARALAKVGHRVTVFCNGPMLQQDDVNYMPLAMYQQYTQWTQHDVSIIQRVPNLFSGANKARLGVLWCHDLALLRQSPVIKGTAWNYDKVLVLSEFMENQYKEVYNFPDELMFRTRNGVDLATIARSREEAKRKADKRNMKRLIFAGRPERGLDVLLGSIMPRVLRKVPDAELIVCGYENKVEHMEDFYNRCSRAAAQLGDRARNIGALTKAQFYELMHLSGCYAYPLPSPEAESFDEISCIAAMEAQACGLPFIGTHRGALPETVHADAGILIKEPVLTDGYYDAFADAVVETITNAEKRQAMSDAGRAHARSLDWQPVAEEWTELFYQEIRKRSSDKASLVNHFWRRSDIYAAEKVLETIPEDDKATAYVRKQIKDHWGFIHSAEGFREQYEKIGATHNAAVFNWSPGEARFQVLKQWLESHPEVKTVLDYGCAHGAYALNMAEQTGRVFTGVDLDSHGIALAKKFRDEQCVSKAAKDSKFFQLDEFKAADTRTRHDCAVAFEVLEHVEKPWELLTWLEQHVVDDGQVLITVPFGPWEYTDYRNYPYRAHVWEFDLQDLHDMLDVKGKGDHAASIQVLQCTASEQTAEPLGWYFINYTVTKENRGKVGEIDMERKCWLQRPRQTVSVNIMAGPGSEETIQWCLNPLEHVADEVVIVDCGLSQAALDGIQRSKVADRVKMVPGVDPKTQGFETPRNMGLEHCTQSWILWVDTDERLVNPSGLTKYLRENLFNGYSIRQCHFAVDTEFSADMPVRLFRNNGTLRWFGMIHEHPEKAINEGPGLTILLPDSSIAHVGYLHESGRKLRFARNLPMLEADEKKYPERLLQKHMIMRDSCLMNSYMFAQLGGRVVPEMVKRAENVIKLWREHFKGKGFFSNADPILYYSDSVKLLGRGFEYSFAMSADKVQVNGNAAAKMVVRFDTMDDCLTELNFRAKTAVESFENRYW